MSTQREKIDCGLPDAILFLRISRVGVFQQPLPITLIDLSNAPLFRPVGSSLSLRPVVLSSPKTGFAPSAWEVLARICQPRVLAYRSGGWPSIWDGTLVGEKV
jgi:hypothetical protein